jgi:ATP/maltotriose-dependent transcriptional regulator MalT
VKEFADDASVELERVYDVAARGCLDEIEALLACFSAAHRLRDPRALALRAMRSVLAGDAPGGVALLHRAVSQSDARMRPYVIDLLAPLLLTVSDVDDAESALGEVGDVPPTLSPALVALRSLIAARRGHDAVSRSLAADAIALARDNDHPMIMARVLQRTSVAAFYREDLAEAQERSLEAARAFERLGTYRHAAIAYSVLFVIAHSWSGDYDVARFYAERITMNGRRAADLSWQNFGLVAQMEIAAESGDHRRLGSIRARLMAHSLHEQYGERLSIVLSTVLANGWSGRFDAARSALLAFRGSDERTLPQRSLCDSLLALTSAATGNVAEARRLARLVISQTTDRMGHEPLVDTRHRRIARIVAAATCMIIGETTRARRALSRAFDPDHSLMQSLTPQGIDETRVAPMLRGYARMITVAAKLVAANRPASGLTPAEMEVLRALPDGVTLAEIAAGFGKSKKTVERQVESIYGKLHVSNRAQAIRRARELGIHA